MLENNDVRPLVSVVLSTYNRSNVLQYAVESVLGQSLTDWELLVIGDACSDDTDQLMQRFVERDKRVSYHNREVNYGEQSGPNNDGVDSSNGRYIAFLNHDDIWMTDHLETLVEAIEKNECDMVFSLVAYINKDNSCRLVGATPTGKYDPTLFVPASSWLVTRELVLEVGPWRAAKDLYNIPSQDWCFRAWKVGKALSMVPILSVVAVPSGLRENAYSAREFEINAQLFEASRDTDLFRQRVLTEVAVGHSDQWLKRYSPLALIKWALINISRHLLVFIGVHPEAARNFIFYPGKGGLIERLRSMRGIT